MITFTSRLRVAPGNGPALEALLTGVRDATRASEPDVLYYDFALSADEPDSYIMIEVYRDAAAHAAHMDARYVTDALPQAMSLVEGAIEVRQYVAPGTEPVIRRFRQA